ncbi:tubulin-like doman-containing protein [Planctomycetota bacterium]
MKKKLFETIKKLSPNGLMVLLGSSANKLGIGVRKTEAVCGLLTDEQKQKILAFDAQDVHSVFDVPIVDKSLEKIELGPNEHIPAEMGDSESLAKAERDKKLWMVASQWHKRPGVCRDNIGTGGNGRIGHALLALNQNKFRRKIRRNLREIGDYQLQRFHMAKDESKKAKKFIPVFVCFSCVGGFGTGVLFRVLNIIREEARDLKLPVKIIIMGLISGSLEPVDAETAARNQELVLCELQARLVGEYRDIGDEDSVHEPPCDSVILISNTNNDGEFNNLDRLIAVAAQHIFYFFHTPFGRKIQEKTVDIEEHWHEDYLGGRRCVSTFGYSKIHLDMPRLLLCIAHKLVSLFLNSLLVDKEQPNAIKLVNIITTEIALSETETHSLALEHIFHLRSLGNNDARQHAITLFQQRAGHRWGFGGCCDMDEASRYTLDVELPQRLVPQIQRETLKLADAAATAISNKVTALLCERDGISKATQFLEGLYKPLGRFEKVNQAKLKRAQSKQKAINDMLGRARNLLNKLKGRFWLWRLLSFSTKREIRLILPPTTEKAIHNQLEIKGRLAIVNDLYPGIRQIIAEQLTEVHKITENVIIVNKDVVSEIDRLQKFNPILLVPVGNEMVTSDFIEKQFKAVLAAEDGEETIAQKTFEQFYSLHKNLKAFNHREPGEIKITLLEYCIDTAYRNLHHLNVADVFKENCKSLTRQKQCIAQAIAESRGRLRITGEADEVIPTMKFIGVNDRNVGEWMVGLANQIDTQNGDWEFVEINDPNTIVLFQNRCQVSLARIINEMAQKWNRPDDLQVRTQLGSDPLLSLIPSASPSTEEIHTVIAMGLISDQIKRTDRGYKLNGHMLEPVYLGKSLEDISRSITSSYPQTVRLYRGFLHKLVKQEHGIVKNLDTVINTVDKSNNSLLAHELGKVPFVRAQKIADALVPYLRRLPFNSTNGGKKHCSD